MEGENIIDSPRDHVGDHIRRYIDTGGADGYLWHGVPTLLLTTRGRRSKKLRRTALIFGRDHGDVVVVASRGGAARHPLWFENLSADPRVSVQIKDVVCSGRARTATAQERPTLWALMCGIWPAYEEYQLRTEREIPIVIISVTGNESVGDAATS